MENTFKTFDDILANLAQQYPAFAGYAKDEVTGDYIIFTADNYKGTSIKNSEANSGRQLGLMKQTFHDYLISQGFVNPSTKVKFHFESRKYSFSDLYDWRVDLRKLMGKGVTSLRIDASKNQVIIGTDENSYALGDMNTLKSQSVPFQASISSLNIPADALGLEASKPQFTGTLRDGHTPMREGDGWSRKANTAGYYRGCSLGVPATYDGQQGFLTASHCSDYLGIDSPKLEGWVGLGTNGTLLGYEYFDPESFICSFNITLRCRNSDVAFWKVYNNSYVDQGRISRTTESAKGDITLDAKIPYRNIVGGGQGADITTVVENVGYVGGWKKAKVSSLDVDFYVNNIMYRGMMEITSNTGLQSTDYATCKGDSGGPWYLKNTDGSVVFLGIQSGTRDTTVMTKIGDSECHKTSIITPLRNILWDFTKSLSYTR